MGGTYIQPLKTLMLLVWVPESEPESWGLPDQCSYGPKPPPLTILANFKKLFIYLNFCV